jgi:hypothetical protein
VSNGDVGYQRLQAAIDCGNVGVHGPFPTPPSSGMVPKPYLNKPRVQRTGSVGDSLTWGYFSNAFGYFSS